MTTTTIKGNISSENIKGKISPQANSKGSIESANANGTACSNTIANGNLGSTISDRNFVFTQMSASNTWVITHNLGKYCAITVVDSAGDEVFGGDVHYNNLNQVTITFCSAFAGKAYCN